MEDALFGKGRKLVSTFLVSRTENSHGCPLNCVPCPLGMGGWSGGPPCSPSTGEGASENHGLDLLMVLAQLGFVLLTAGPEC